MQEQKEDSADGNFFMTFAASEETAELVFSNTFILHYKVQDESGW